MKKLLVILAICFIPFIDGVYAYIQPEVNSYTEAYYEWLEMADRYQYGPTVGD